MNTPRNLGLSAQLRSDTLLFQFHSFENAVEGAWCQRVTRLAGRRYETRLHPYA